MGVKSQERNHPVWPQLVDSEIDMTSDQNEFQNLHRNKMLFQTFWYYAGKTAKIQVI